MINFLLGAVKIWNSVRKPFVIIVSVTVLFLFGLYLFGHGRLVGDVASHLLLAVSPILKIGSPYKDFWETKPPVWPLILYLWSSFFGFTIISINFISTIIAGLIVFVSYFIYRKVFSTPVFEMVFLFTVVVVLSPLLHTIMLPTEILGLLFSLGGLYALVCIRKDFPKFYLSGLLLFAASQTKEPYTFTFLAVLPVFIGAILQNGFVKFIKNVLQFVMGVFTCSVGIYIYLASLGSVSSYIEIFMDKAHDYPIKYQTLTSNFIPGFLAAERTFTEFTGAFAILGILAIFSFYFANKFKKTLSFHLRSSRLVTKPLIIAGPENINKYTVFFYSLGSFVGFGLQDNFGSHYLIQVVIPFYLITGLIVSYLFNNILFLFKKSKLYFYLALLLFVFSAVVILPKRQYFFSYIPKAINIITTDRVENYERRIAEITTKDQCILSVYGWGVSENYLYSERKPCTRFFLANIVLRDWQKKEYAKSIMENPPAAILYQTAGADMNVKKFETEVINISKIIKNCYTHDVEEKAIYIPITKNINDLKDCIKTNSI